LTYPPAVIVEITHRNKIFETTTVGSGKSGSVTKFMGQDEKNETNNFKRNGKSAAAANARNVKCLEKDATRDGRLVKPLKKIFRKSQQRKIYSATRLNSTL